MNGWEIARGLVAYGSSWPGGSCRGVRSRGAPGRGAPALEPPAIQLFFLTTLFSDLTNLLYDLAILLCT